MNRTKNGTWLAALLFIDQGHLRDRLRPLGLLVDEAGERSAPILIQLPETQMDILRRSHEDISGPFLDRGGEDTHAPRLHLLDFSEEGNGPGSLVVGVAIGGTPNSDFFHELTPWTRR